MKEVKTKKIYFIIIFENKIFLDNENILCYISTLQKYI